MKNLPVRKKIRLKGYDYSRAGRYFITICVKGKHEMLGTVCVDIDVDVDVGAIINRPDTNRPDTNRPHTNRPSTAYADVGAIINRPQHTPAVGAIINRLDTNRPDDAHTAPATIELSEYGEIAKFAIHEIPAHYTGVAVDKYVIMPNHMHMILVINHGMGMERGMGMGHGMGLGHGRLIIAPTDATVNATATISTIIQQLKRQISKQIGFSLFQRSYHDHIIRDEAEYQRICRYIDENPANWQEDCYYT